MKDEWKFVKIIPKMGPPIWFGPCFVMMLGELIMPKLFVHNWTIDQTVSRHNIINSGCSIDLITSDIGAQPLRNAYFGQGNAPHYNIILSYNFYCSSNETALLECLTYPSRQCRGI